jgi:hypothetical protein
LAQVNQNKMAYLTPIGFDLEVPQGGGEGRRRPSAHLVAPTTGRDGALPTGRRRDSATSPASGTVTFAPGNDQDHRHPNHPTRSTRQRAFSVVLTDAKRHLGDRTGIATTSTTPAAPPPPPSLSVPTPRSKATAEPTFRFTVTLSQGSGPVTVAYDPNGRRRRATTVRSGTLTFAPAGPPR